MKQDPVSLLDPQAQKCPYPFYARLRKDSPVQFMPDLGVYFIANYELARKVLVDSRNFTKASMQDDGRRHVEPSKLMQEILLAKDVGLPISMMAQREGKEHRANRALLDSYFHFSSVRKLDDQITATAAALIDGLAGRKEIEVVGDFAIPLPIYVIADMMGIPKSRYLDYRRWSEAMVAYASMTVPDDEAVAAAHSLVEMHRFMLDEIAQRRAQPRDDLLTVLAKAEIDGRPLQDRELCGFADELLVAGNETTTGTIAGGLLYLSQDPELQSLLRGNPDLIEKFAEECLRTSTPLQMSYRYALGDVTVGGVEIPAGSKILVGLMSANRDECVFADPDRIDPTRSQRESHISFGAGIHHCLGAELARHELRIAFRLWLERFSAIELAQDPDTIDYPNAMAIRVPLAFKVRCQIAR